MNGWPFNRSKPTPAPTTRTVQVIVRDRDNRDIDGAQVTLHTPGIVTASTTHGLVTLTIPVGLADTHLLVSVSGYVLIDQHINVAGIAQVWIGGGVPSPTTLCLPPMQPVYVPTPITRPVVRWPALGASYYAALTDPDLNAPMFAAWLRSVGATFTRTWLLDAWAVGGRGRDGRFLPGQYNGYLPVWSADGRYDLNAWSEPYFARLREFTDAMNREGVWPHFTVLDLYTWSARKAGLPFVPDPNKGPWRNNVNGTRWGDPDDDTFSTLPDTWLTMFMRRVVDTLDGTSYVIEIGNEMPEKEMHLRIRDTLRGCGYAGEITVNRNEDTPGQVWNMGIDKGAYDRIALHGMLDLGYLDQVYPEEAAAGRPTTFRDMWPMVDPARIILSSDGGGGNPAHLDTLREVAADALQRGASYEHQLALKRNRFYGDGTLRMADLAIDEPMLRSLKGGAK